MVMKFEVFESEVYGQVFVANYPVDLPHAIVLKLVTKTSPHFHSEVHIQQGICHLVLALGAISRKSWVLFFSTFSLSRSSRMFV